MRGCSTREREEEREREREREKEREKKQKKIDNTAHLLYNVLQRVHRIECVVFGREAEALDRAAHRRGEIVADALHRSRREVRRTCCARRSLTPPCPRPPPGRRRLEAQHPSLEKHFFGAKLVELLFQLLERLLIVLAERAAALRVAPRAHFAQRQRRDIALPLLNLRLHLRHVPQRAFHGAPDRVAMRDSLNLLHRIAPRRGAVEVIAAALLPLFLHALRDPPPVRSVVVRPAHVLRAA